MLATIAVVGAAIVGVLSGIALQMVEEDWFDISLRPFWLRLFMCFFNAGLVFAGTYAFAKALLAIVHL